MTGRNLKAGAGHGLGSAMNCETWVGHVLEVASYAALRRAMSTEQGARLATLMAFAAKIASRTLG